MRPSLRHPSDAALLFGGLAVFGVLVGLLYWFLTYENAGTVMLLGFGTASGIASVSLWAKPPRGEIGARGAAGDASEAPAGVEYERIPAPAFAPVIISAGLAITAIAVALGALLLPVGITVALIGARYWLQAAMREADTGDELT